MSICRGSPSLQQAVRAAASIYGGNEDTAEARGKGYNEVGGEEKQVECLGKKVSAGSGIMKSSNAWVNDLKIIRRTVSKARRRHFRNKY